ncbi:toprim domain-containing protein [Alkalihalobacillus deserti]|uniref:toprim domain-containing protein n=1 Tax=Alkalihalobacillus deserti TaxID=2879466 RepID=UPI001D13487C|nr:toprim domain-containing protein [Alkalihalobacillus deserti]
MEDKVLIVEGRSDRKRIRQVLAEEVEVVCTNGTLSQEKLETLIFPIEDMDVFILVDADDAGESLRKQLRRELPNATHLYTQKEYGQVETTPFHYLTQILRAHFEVKEIF